MALNPMAFVTQPTPVGASRIGSGVAVGSAIAQNRLDKDRQKISQGYLELQTEQHNLSKKRFQQAELDKAIADLDDARLFGNPDAVSAAEDRLRQIAQRNGYQISAEASAPGAVVSASESTQLGGAGELAPGEVGSEENPLDVDAYDAANAALKQGDKGPAVKAFQQGLISEGFLPEGEDDGVFGPITAAAVEMRDIASRRGGDGEPVPEEDVESKLQKEILLSRSFGGSLPPNAQVVGAGAQASPRPENLQDFRSATASAPRVAAFSMPGSLPPRPNLSSLTITDSKGNRLYSASGDGQAVAERQRQRALGVFSELEKQAGDDQERQFIRAAGGTAAKLVGTMPLEKAVQTGLSLYQDAMTRRNSLAVVEANRKPKYGSGGGGASGGVSFKVDSALNDDVDKVRTMWVNSAGYKKMEEQAGLLDDAEGGLMSPDGVAQNNALATLRRIQSGLTLNAQEMRDFETSAGFLEALKKKFSRYLGEGELPEEYKRQVQGTMQHMREIINRRMERGAQEAYDYWVKTRGRSAKPDVIEEKGQALKESLRGGSTGAQGGGSKREKAKRLGF